MPFLHRRLGTPLFNSMLRILTGARVSDSQSGFRAFRRDTVLALNIRTPGFECVTELLLRASRAGLDIREGALRLPPASRRQQTEHAARRVEAPAHATDPEPPSHPGVSRRCGSDARPPSQLGIVTCPGWTRYWRTAVGAGVHRPASSHPRSAGYVGRSACLPPVGPDPSAPTVSTWIHGTPERGGLIADAVSLCRPGRAGA